MSSSLPVRDDDNRPQLPGFRNWRAVYLFLLGALAFYIVLFAAWSRWFA